MFDFKFSFIRAITNEDIIINNRLSTTAKCLFRMVQVIPVSKIRVTMYVYIMVIPYLNKQTSEYVTAVTNP